MIDVTCPKCRVELEVPTNQAGSRVTCPECEHTFVVPRPGAIKAGRPTATKAEAPRGPRSSSSRPPALPPRGKRPPKRRRDEDDEDEDSGGGSNLGLILGLSAGGVLVVALIGVGLWLALRSNNSNNTNAQAKNNAPINAPAPPQPPMGAMGGRPGFPPAGMAGGPMNTPPAVTPHTGNPPVTKGPTPQTPAPKPPEEKTPSSSTPPPVPTENSGLTDFVLKSTVWLIVPQADGKIAAGTGSLIDKANRLVLTNFHVVEGAREVAVLFPIFEEGQLVQNRDKYLHIAQNQPDSVLKAPVIAQDNKRDLALVQLPQLPDNVLPLGVADKDVAQGQDVHSLGNPGAGGFMWVYARGRVRAVSRKHKWKAGGGGSVLDLESDVILTDSPTNPGDSGGPLVNEQGQLVGVTHGLDPNSRGFSLFINRTEVIDFVKTQCANKGLTWDKSDRKLDVVAGGPSEADLPTLVKDLRSPDSAARARAARQLGAMGVKAAQAVDELITLLKDPEKLPKRLALEALGKIGPEARSAAGALLEILKDPSDAGMRRDAAKALGKIGSAVKSQAFPVLAAALEDTDKEVRMAAAEAMASLGPLERDDLRVVLKVLKSTDPDLRARAARALGQFPAQAKEVIPELVTAYNAPGADKQLRVEVVTSLGNFGPEAVAALPVLTEALKSRQPELVRAACQAAGKLGAEAGKLVPEMASAMDGGDMPTKKEILGALQKLGPAAKEAAPALGKILGEKDRDARLEALKVLEALGKDGKAAAPQVVGLFADEVDWSERIMKVLQKMGKDIVSDLINGLNNQHPNVRLGCARTLGALGKDARQARAKLGRLAQTDSHPAVQRAAYQAWLSIGQR
jgi:HEAT repeat protein/S1-C subfamily serine protease